MAGVQVCPTLVVSCKSISPTLKVCIARTPINQTCEKTGATPGNLEIIFGGCVSKPHVLACADTCCTGQTKGSDGATVGNCIKTKAAKNKAVFFPMEREPDTTHNEGTLLAGSSSDSVMEHDTTQKCGLRTSHNGSQTVQGCDVVKEVSKLNLESHVETEEQAKVKTDEKIVKQLCSTLPSYRYPRVVFSFGSCPPSLGNRSVKELPMEIPFPRATKNLPART